MNNKQDGNTAKERKTNFIKIKKIIKYILIMAQIVTPIVSVYVIWKTNTLTDTANLLQLNNVILAKTEAIYSIESKRNEADEDQLLSINEDRQIAVTSLLNIFEFACQQYINNKIDRKAFKSLYYNMIEDIMSEHIIPNNIDKKFLPSIRKVYVEWYFE